MFEWNLKGLRKINQAKKGLKMELEQVVGREESVWNPEGSV